MRPLRRLSRPLACAAVLLLTALGAPGAAGPAAASSAGWAGALATPPAVAPVADPAPPPVTWGIAPSGPGNRTAFQYAATPGEVLRDVVAVNNYTEQELTLAVYASDAVKHSEGVFDLLPAADRPTDVGAWVDLGRPTVTIPPRSRIDVPFRITIPENATPGDHAGGIVTSMTSREHDAVGGRLSVDRRVGARIYLRVAGTLDPRLSVGHVDASFHGLPFGQPGTMRVEYTVRNDGNLRLTGRPSVRVTGPFGLGERRWMGDPLPELLPGDSITRSATVDGVWQMGRLTLGVEIRLEASGGQALDPQPPPGHAAARLWAVPWIALAVLVGIAALAALRPWRRRGGQTRPCLTPGVAGPGSEVDPSAPTPS